MPTGCPQRSLNILVCEDEAIIALALEQALLAMGHQVCAIVATGNDAVAAARHHRPDVVMMDIMLRGARDGIDAATEIVESFGIRSLFMTAVDAPKVRERAASAKALGFLMKPYRGEELRRILAGIEAAERPALVHAQSVASPYRVTAL